MHDSFCCTHAAFYNINVVLSDINVVIYNIDVVPSDINVVIYGIDVVPSDINVVICSIDVVPSDIDVVFYGIDVVHICAHADSRVVTTPQRVKINAPSIKFKFFCLPVHLIMEIY